MICCSFGIWFIFVCVTNSFVNIVTDYRMSDSKEKLTLQQNEMNAINAMVLSIASHCDRIQFSLKYTH
jgi:hypothetical protein